MANNIFAYAPKELTTDAFLKWLFVELDRNADLKPFQNRVFAALGLCASVDSVSEVNVDLQTDNIDLLICYKVNGDERKALFENKTWTTFHSQQLQRYHKIGEEIGVTDYIYLKLSYVHSQEEMDVRSAGYRLLDGEDLALAIAHVADRHYLVGQYEEFLKEELLVPRQKIIAAIDDGRDADVFGRAGGQKIFLDRIREKYGDASSSWLQVGTNKGGSPWAELFFCKTDNIYGDRPEHVFLRVDKRSGSYYARLNQYADNGDVFWNEKEKRLVKLRGKANELLAHSKLTPGKVQDTGKKESEIAIFFLDDNPLHLLLEELPPLMRQFADAYDEL